MKVIRVNDEDGKGFVRGIIGEDVEFVNPLEHLKGQTIQREAIRTKDMLSMKNAFMASMVSDEWYEKKGAEAWQRVYDGILKTEVPKNFIALLESKSKDEQEKLLRGQSLTLTN